MNLPPTASDPDGARDVPPAGGKGRRWLLCGAGLLAVTAAVVLLVWWRLRKTEPPPAAGPVRPTPARVQPVFEHRPGRPLRRQRDLPPLPQGRTRLLPPHRHGALDGGRGPRPASRRTPLSTTPLETPLPNRPQGRRALAPRIAPDGRAAGSAPGGASRQVRGGFGAARPHLSGRGGRLPRGIAGDVVRLPVRVGHVARLRRPRPVRLLASRRRGVPVLSRRAIRGGRAKPPPHEHPRGGDRLRAVPRPRLCARRAPRGPRRRRTDRRPSITPSSTRPTCRASCPRPSASSAT